MRNGIKRICYILVLVIAFILGWRLMPSAWPEIKESVVYPIFPQVRPEPTPTQEPYKPKGNTAFGEPINKKDSVIYYFYKDYCPYCRALTMITDALPEQIYLQDGSISNVRLICLNKAEDQYLKVIMDYYEMYNIPDERR